MQFRLDFRDKLDLSRIKKQIPHYISTVQNLAYEIYLLDYKVSFNIETPTSVTAHHVSIVFYEIKRDKDGDVIKENIISPLTDTRFQELKAIQDVFVPGNYRAEFNSNSSTETTDKICKILTILFKINKLKVFI